MPDAARTRAPSGSRSPPLTLGVTGAPRVAWETRRPEEAPLRRGEVQVWLASLAAPAEQVERAARLLSGDERRRAERFRFDEHRRRFVLAHAQWRRLLGAHLGCPPEAVELAEGPRGKPWLRGPAPARPLGLNLSHSGDVALFAAAYDRRVGVDVEVLSRRVDVWSLAARVLTERERARLDGLAGEALHREFLRAWTRKESWIKALGDGLSRDLQSFEVLEESVTGTAVERSATDGGERWWLRDLAPREDAVGCLAADGAPAAVRLLALPPPRD